MCVTPDGNVLVTGVYQGTAVFDAITLHSAGEQDIFLAELNAILITTIARTRAAKSKMMTIAEIRKQTISIKQKHTTARR
jgi:hypothetical protein